MIPSEMVTAALALLLDITWKSTLVLVVALLLARMLKRASAATRHLLWAAALVGLLVIPVASACLPAWHLDFGKPALEAWSRSGESETSIEYARMANEPINGAVPPSSGTPFPAAGPLIVASRGAALPSPLQSELAPIENQP